MLCLQRSTRLLHCSRKESRQTVTQHSAEGRLHVLQELYHCPVRRHFQHSSSRYAVCAFDWYWPLLYFTLLHVLRLHQLQSGFGYPGRCPQKTKWFFWGVNPPKKLDKNLPPNLIAMYSLVTRFTVFKFKYLLLAHYLAFFICLPCFDIVGWASGRASGL